MVQIYSLEHLIQNKDVTNWKTTEGTTDVNSTQISTAKINFLKVMFQQETGAVSIVFLVLKSHFICQTVILLFFCRFSSENVSKICLCNRLTMNKCPKKIKNFFCFVLLSDMYTVVSGLQFMIFIFYFWPIYFTIQIQKV